MSMIYRQARPTKFGQGGGKNLGARKVRGIFSGPPSEKGKKCKKYQFYDRMNIFIKNAQGEQMISEGQKNP